MGDGRASRAAIVAVDANGADLGPAEVAAGAALAVEAGERVLLFGPAEQLERLPAGVEVVDAPVSIAKRPDPVRAVRTTPEASIVQATRAVGEGRAQALVCAGGTGAALAAGLGHIRRARGIYRPALALPLPLPGHGAVTLLDVGANTEARREQLVQFAFMGAALRAACSASSVPASVCCPTGRSPGAVPRRSPRPTASWPNRACAARPSSSSATSRATTSSRAAPMWS